MYRFLEAIITDGDMFLFSFALHDRLIFKLSRAGKISSAQYWGRVYFNIMQASYKSQDVPSNYEKLRVACDIFSNI